MANQEVEAFKQLLAAGAAESEGQERTLADMRNGYEQLGGAFPIADDVQIEAVSADGVSSQFTNISGTTSDSVLFYLHGGGYVIGSLTTHQSLVADICRAAGIKGLAVDYELAPEGQFPCALRDAVKAYQWLLSTGVKAENIVIAGDSAGGGLTVATLVKLRDQNIALPGAAILLSPWADLTHTSDSMDSRAEEDPMVSRESLAMMADMYLAGADPKNPEASPVFSDLTGLPPMLIQVGTAEVLLDDSRLLTKNAKAAGVDVTLQEWDEMVHVFPHYAPIISDGRKAIDQMGEFIRAKLG
ncbi:MAG: alpha/beta hydrolase [Pseudomonadales bacterium]|nr:alpha/beta hydrolase [Pseudomonadales bacterium]